MTILASRALTVGFARLTATLLLLLAVAGVTAVAQTSNTDGSTPAGLAPGAPTGSYALSGFESVNVFNGGLNFSLPLLKVGGRGGVGHALPLTIEQKWRVELFAEMAPGEQPRYTPLGEWWGELRPGYGPGVMEGRRAGSGEWHQESHCGSAGSGFFAQMITRLTFTAADGTEFELRDQLTGGQPAYLGDVPCSLAGNSRGSVFVTSDGSSATFISDATIYDYKHNPMGLNDQFRPSGYLLMRDGTRYRVDGGLVSWMRDRNGNRVSFSYDMYGRVSAVTDPLDRQVTITYAGTNGTSYDLITYQGFGGQSRAIKVWQAPLQTSPTVHLLRTTQPGDIATTKTYAQLFPQMGGASTYSYFNPTKPSKVELPDGRFYQFRYNEYGEMARVELPTGGSIEYDWVDGSRGEDSFVYRRASTRRVYREGSTLESKTTYGEDGYVRAFDSGGALAAQTRHYFHGDAFASLAPDPTRTPVTPAPWRQGREYRTEFFDIVNGSPVLRRKVEHTWQQPAAGTSWPLTQAETDEKARANNPQITETLITLSDTNQVSKQAFAYDLYSNRTDAWEHDYGVGSSGALVRHTRTDYLSTHPASGADYASPSPTAASIHLRGLPVRTSVYDAAGVEQSRTIFEYDNYATDPNHAALVDRPGITGFDPSFSASYHARGNATATDRYLLTNGAVTGSVSASAQYDVAGNAVKTIDGRGIASAVSYNDSFSDGVARNIYAFPTGTTSAVPAPSPGPYAGRGSTTPLTSSAVYDYWTGLLTSSTDANGKVTSYEYNDPIDRLTDVNRPDGGWTDHWYGRNAYGDYVGTRSAINASQSTEGYLFFDGLGRGARTFQYDGSLWLTTDTQYDALGRAWRVSANPYLSGGSGSPVNPSNQWVETTFDALGRPTHVKTTADGAQVVTSYGGNTVTVTDQAGKARKSVSNALGRLTQVVEAPGVGTCQQDGAGCATDYTYDALGNLRQVAQGGQHRYFMYDSLGRLVRARNPEQAVNGALNTAADPWSGNSQWSLGYTYDANGNLHQRTDARGVTTTYAYDNLNRPVRTDYSDSTPFTLHTYDFATNGRGRFYADYESSTEGTTNYVTAYDEAGRPTSRRTDFHLNGAGWVGFYLSAREYDLAGNVTSQTYPSGHTVSYNYDVAGRLADNGAERPAFSGHLGDGAARTYSASVSYDGAGRMRQERFGTTQPLYHKRHFNARGQLYDARLSTVEWQLSGAGEWDWNRGLVALWYGNLSTPHGGSSADNNGNVVRSHSSVPLNDQISEYSYHEQRYAYDALNRLSSVTEYAGTQSAFGAAHAAQAYTYDRFGNRQIDAGGTWLGSPAAPPDPRVNETQFGMEEAASRNRLLAPGDAPLPEANRRMRYDAAGNLVKDAYTGAGTRTYDAENRMTEAWGHSATLGGPYLNRYVYDAAGKRVRRKTDAGEAWYVHGFDGELLAEYAAAGSPSSPKKEYGYRAGEMLVVAEAGGGYTSDAAAAFSPSQNPAGPWAYGYKPSGGQFTPLSAPSTIFGAGAATWSPHAQSCCPSVTKNTTGSTLSYPNAPNVVQPPDTLNLHPGPSGERAAVRWTAPESGDYTIAGRFQGIDTFGTTTDVKIEHNGTTIFSGQVGGYGAQVPFTLTRAVAAGEALEFSVGYGANLTYDCDSTGLAVAVTATGGAPTWQNVAGVSVSGGGLTKTGAQGWGDAGASSVEAIQSGDGSVEFTATETTTYRMAGLSSDDAHQSFTDIDFAIYPAAGGALYVYEGGAQIAQVGGYAAGDRLKVAVEGGVVKYYRNGALVWTSAAAPTYPLRVDTALFSVGATIQSVAFSAAGQASQVRWVVTDHLGTPRMTADQTGLLSGIRRHDYLPFGEEVVAGVGGRTASQGYSQTDGVNQKFTGKERDSETGLDYFLARYYSGTQGRFTSPDPILINQDRQLDPQSLNLYVYARNNPLAYIDPTGMERVRLGQHTDEEIDKRVGEIDSALHQDGMTQEQIRALQSERNTLLLEQEGNKVGNAFLAALDKIGARGGLQLSDLTLSTTPATDFQALYTGKNKLTPGQEKELVKGATDPFTTAMVLRKGDGTMISREIFILRPSLAYQGTLGGGLDYKGKIGVVTPGDLAIFGGTNLRHEQYHRDVGPSETRAYSLQLRVLNQFGPGAFANKQFYNYLREGFSKGARTGSP